MGQVVRKGVSLASPRIKFFGLLLLYSAFLTSTIDSKAALDLTEREQFFFERFSVRDGLSHDGVTSITQDALGNMWFGTLLGLNRFDGVQFKQFMNEQGDPNSAPAGAILSLEPLEGGDLLVGSGRGLSYFDHKLSIFVPVTTIAPRNAVNSITRVQDFILIGTSGGLFQGKMTGRRFELNPVENSNTLNIYSTHITKAKDTFIGSSNGLFRFVNGNLIKIEIDNTINPKIRRITSDVRGIWVATYNQGVHLISASGAKLQSYSHGSNEKAGELSGTEIRALMIDDSSAEVWVGTDEGLNVVEPSGEIRIAEHHSANPTSLSANLVVDIYKDESGSNWVSTAGGISKYNTNLNYFSIHNENSTTLPGLVSNSILEFSESPDRTVWIGTQDGVAEWQPGSDKFVHHSAKDLGLADSRVMSIAETDERLFLGTMRGGLHVLNKHPLTLEESYSRQGSDVHTRIPSDAISKILIAADGTKWIGTHGQGLFMLGERNLANSQPISTILSGKKIVDLAETNDHNIWIATYGYGITILDPLANSFRSLRHSVKDPNSISSDETSSLLISGDTIWIGTMKHGLNSYDRATGKITRFTTKDGLASNIVYALELGSENDVWISGPKGLTRLNPETNTFTNFNTSHGLQGDDFNHGASLAMSNGTLLFGGNNGFNAFKPAEVKLNDHMGNMLITKFNKFNRVVNPGEALNAETTLELTHEENVFGFEYALMDFASAKDNTYDYRMVGFDKDWVDAGSSRSATYTNLDAGHYRFEVRGRNNDGLLSDKIASVNVYVAPAPWRTWYAYTFYCLLALAIFFVAFRNYTREVIRRTNEKRNQEEKERLEELITIRTVELNEKVLEQARTLEQKDLANKEIHHRVKNNLQVILGLLTLQAESEENEKFQEAMNQIRQRVTSMSLIHKSLYEHSVASIDFRQYVENLISSIRQFHPALANGKICIHLDLANIVLDIDTALPLGLILNELVTNSIKHGFDKGRTANPQIIEISCQQVEDACVMAVTDNGIGLPDGFDIESPTSMGSELILIFTQQLQGSINAQNKQDGGSIFQLSFPMKSARESNA